MTSSYDFIVVGGGIVGLATALRLLQRRPQATVAVIEKESQVGTHQSGHNSGVIHAGVYYEPGSAKAILCRAGLNQTIAFCTRYDIPFKQCGKLIVATDRNEQARLDTLATRAVNNAVVCRLLGKEELKEVEPSVIGTGALLVSETGIVDYNVICRKLAELIRELGGEIFLRSKLFGITESNQSVGLATTTGDFTGKQLIACAGLHADRIARMAGLEIDFAILPFRGDFYRLAPHLAQVVNHLIYPVPDPSLPFLGIHLTRTIDGGMTVGPSAMLALHREGYGKYAVSPPDVIEMLSFRGLWRLLARYPSAGLREVGHFLSRRGYLRAVQKYCPSVELADLRSHSSGVRAQAVTRDGQLIHDFLINRSPRTTHICNAPSPAATAALPIADSILDEIDV
jgi:(S)-2-hydroxyglutarate dehydrogenase